MLTLWRHQARDKSCSALTYITFTHNSPRAFVPVLTRRYVCYLSFMFTAYPLLPPTLFLGSLFHADL